MSLRTLTVDGKRYEIHGWGSPEPRVYCVFPRKMTRYGYVFDQDSVHRYCHPDNLTHRRVLDHYRAESEPWAAVTMAVIRNAACVPWKRGWSPLDALEVLFTAEDKAAFKARWAAPVGV